MRACVRVTVKPSGKTEPTARIFMSREKRLKTERRGSGGEDGDGGGGGGGGGGTDCSFGCKQTEVVSL